MTRRRLVSAAITIVIAGAIAGTRDQAPTYDVVRVVDGDTIVINEAGSSITVRLIGVDTPETKHPKKPIEHYGPEATTFTRNLLRGEKVRLKGRSANDDTDRYDRRLAFVYREPDGLFINEELVRQGYARAYTRYPFKHSDRFLDWQSKAQAAKRGLWDPP